MLRRKYVRQLSAWAITTAVGVAALAGNGRYLNNFARGPFAITADQLATVSDVSTTPRYFVRIAGGAALETGLQEETVETSAGVEVSRHVSSAYYAMPVGDRLLIVKSATSPGTQATGALEPLPLDLESHLFDSPSKAAARARFYPFYLDAASPFRVGGYWAIGLGLGFLVLLVWRWGIAWRRLHDLMSDPVAKRVAAWGDPVMTAGAIEQELAAPGLKKHGAWTFTPSYLVSRSFFGFNVLRFRDLLWGFKKVTQRRINFIPAGKYYTAIMHCYGGTAEVQASEKKVDELLREAGARAPWAAIGFSKELETLWTKQNQEFCAAIEQRRGAPV